MIVITTDVGSKGAKASASAASVVRNSFMSGLNVTIEIVSIWVVFKFCRAVVSIKALLSTHSIDDAVPQTQRHHFRVAHPLRDKKGEKEILADQSPQKHNFPRNG